MRTLSGLLLLLGAVSVNAEERTWTISTGTYTVAAELVEVHGDIAYLKIGDKVEHIPFARLSGADQLYVMSQGPTMVFPGPAEEKVVEESLPGPTNELNAFPLGGSGAVEQGTPLNVTANKPPIEPLPSPLQPLSNATIRSNYTEELPPIPATNKSLLRNGPPKTDPRALNSASANPNARRSVEQQKQNNTSNKNRSREEDRRGLFGGRSRLLGNGR